MSDEKNELMDDLKELQKLLESFGETNLDDLSEEIGIDLNELESQMFNQVPKMDLEYSSTNEEILKKAINTTGNGTVVTVGVEVDVDGQPFSLQEFNIQALLGRMI